MMFWDTDRSTVGVQLNGVEARLGQDNFWYVKNQSGSPILKGKAVMAVGTLGSSGRILIDEMIANGSVSSKFLLGVTAETIANGSDGFVMNIGKIRQLDTSMYTAGDTLYCDPTTPGNLTNVAPIAPNLKLPVAFVVHAASNGTIAVRSTQGSDLYEDHRVQVNTGTLADGQLLRYNLANLRWENWTPNFVPSTRNITINGTTQDLSVDRTWTVSATPGVYTAALSVDTNDLNASIAGDGILTLTPTTNVKLTGLQGGANGRTITIFNGSDNYFVFLECNTTSSSAGNRFFNPTGSYIILAPLEMQRFTYNSVTNSWVSGPLHLSNQFEMFDDFQGYISSVAITSWGIGMGAWSLRAAGTTGASASAYLGAIDRLTRRGTYQLRVGQTATNWMGFTANGTSASGGNLRITAAPAGSYRIMTGSITSLSDMNTINCTIVVGFPAAPQSVTPGAAGVFWRYGPTDSIGGGGTGTWKCNIDAITIDSGLVYTAGNLDQLGVITYLGGGGLNTYSCFYAVTNGVISFGVRENAATNTGETPWTHVVRSANSATNSDVLIDYMGFKTNLANPT
jgi:hypothetical protein